MEPHAKYQHSLRISGWELVCSVQCAVCSVQCAVQCVVWEAVLYDCSVQHAVCSLECDCSIFSLQCSVIAVCSIQCRVSRSAVECDCSIFSLQCRVECSLRSLTGLPLERGSIQFLHFLFLRLAHIYSKKYLYTHWGNYSLDFMLSPSVTGHGLHRLGLKSIEVKLKSNEAKPSWTSTWPKWTWVGVARGDPSQTPIKSIEAKLKSDEAKPSWTSTWPRWTWSEVAQGGGQVHRGQVHQS